MTDFGRWLIPPDHASRHEDAGADEVDAALLNGRINYVDRGDPSSVDFTLSSFTTDGDWHDLNLSSIVPANASFVKAAILINDGGVANNIRFRKKGNINNRVSPVITIQVASISMTVDFTVPCDSDRVIEYLASSTTWTNIKLTVQGWFI
jgi:hypothetical protein